MTEFDYPKPVSKLLTQGDCRGMRQWPDYLALGIGLEHVPDLVRMIHDDELNRADPQSLEVWAPVHAWRTLGQLRAETAIEPLMGLLEQIDEDYEQWIGEELPQVLGLVGPAAVPRLAECLTTPHDGMWAQTTAAVALAEIGNRYPEARGACITALVKGLENFASQDQGLNGFLVSSLVDLKAVEAAPLMEKAFASDCVDILILGDWEEVQIRLGLLDERQTPAWRPIPVPAPLRPQRRQPTRTLAKAQPKDKRKAERRRRDSRKAKRKRQKQARRKQRKRK